MHACRLMAHVCTEARRGHELCCSTALHLVPLRQGLPLNPELEWCAASPSGLPVWLLPSPVLHWNPGPCACQQMLLGTEPSPQPPLMWPVLSWMVSFFMGSTLTALGHVLYAAVLEKLLLCQSHKNTLLYTLGLLALILVFCQLGVNFCGQHELGSNLILQVDSPLSWG